MGVYFRSVVTRPPGPVRRCVEWSRGRGCTGGATAPALWRRDRSCRAVLATPTADARAVGGQTATSMNIVFVEENDFLEVAWPAGCPGTRHGGFSRGSAGAP